LQDRLTGLARIGNGVLLSHDQQADLVNKIDRRKAAIATDPRMIERPNYDRYLEGLSAAEERLWLDYSRRLMSDPAAGFGEDPTQ
jgi:hypothetical protein